MAHKSADETKQTWNSITGTATVYANEFEGRKGKYLSFSLSIGKKLEGDKEYTNYYFPVRFGKDVKIPDKPGKHNLEIYDGWITINAYTRGKGRNAEDIIEPMIFVNDGKFI